MDLDSGKEVTMILREFSKAGTVAHPDVLKEMRSHGDEFFQAWIKKRVAARFRDNGFDLSKPIGRKRYNDNPDDFVFTQPPEVGSETFKVE